MPNESTEDRLHTIAKQYNINTEKPHFPVNTMRLYYLLLTDERTNGEKEALDSVNSVIPKISAILDARDLALSSKKEEESPGPDFEFNACKKQIDELLKQVNTPQLHQTIQMLFSEVYPLQESLLHSIDQYLKKDELQINDLMATLKIRAMDSVLYAGVISQIIDEYLPQEGDNQAQINMMYNQVNATLEINDLIDAIVYAKQDLASKSATLVEIIKRIDSSNSGIEETLNTTFEKLKSIAITEKSTQTKVFVEKLINVISTEKGQKEKPAEASPNPTQPPATQNPQPQQQPTTPAPQPTPPPVNPTALPVTGPVIPQTQVNTTKQSQVK